MNDQPNPTQSAKDDGILHELNAALSNPLALAQIAAALNPSAVRSGEMREPLERAAALLIEAGIFCEQMEHKSFPDLVLELVKHPADYERIVSSTKIKFEPAVLILSKNEAKDTLRQFLREKVNFEGKDVTDKRRAWRKKRMVWDNLLRWFIDRTNEHNKVFGENDWRDGKTEFDKAKKAWEKDGDCHIPRNVFEDTGEETRDSELFPLLPRKPDCHFIPWFRRVKGTLKAIRQLSRDEILPSSEKTTVNKKISERAKQNERQNRKNPTKSPPIPKRASQR